MAEHGFLVRFEIESREWEKAKILRIVHQVDEQAERIEPARHFAPILASIRGQAIEHYGPFVDNRLARRWLTEDRS